MCIDLDSIKFTEVDRFYFTILEYVRDYTNFKQYEVMSEESRNKWREKLTIMVCKKFSPRSNYDISKDEVRAMVADALAVWTVDDE